MTPSNANPTTSTPPVSPRKPEATFLGFPLDGFGFFTSLLLTASSGFLAFFLVTALSIFGFMFWNLLGHHSENYANTYIYFGFPAAVVVWLVATGVFGTLWVRATIKAK